MSGADWLFNGTPPPNVTGGSASSQGMPEWYMQYLQGMAGRGLDFASMPYAPYPGQRLADFNSTQQLGFQNAYENQGAWQPAWEQAHGMAQQIAPWAQQQVGMGNQAAQGAINSVAGPAERTSSALAPWLQAGQGFANLGANAAAGPAQQVAGQVSPMVGAAANYGSQALDRASVPAQNWTQNWQQYMSPYTQAVTSEIARLGNQNLTENILPAVNDNFISSGQFGSTRNMDMLNRAMRDSQREILGQQSQALQSGYGTSANIFGADANRMQAQAGLESQTALGAGQLNAGLIGQYGNVLGSDANREQQQQQLQQQGFFGAGNMMQGMGGLSQQALSADAARQQAQQGLQAQTGLGAAGVYNQGGGLGAQAFGTGAQLTGGLGQMLQNQLGTDVNALLGVGQMQQGLEQQGYDTSYNNFLQQRDWGWQQLGNLSNLLRGYQMPTSQTQAYNGPLPGSAYGASPLASMIALYGGSRIGG